ncbi:MAG: D-glucuronyl C5-epimerase family protein [Candidatus Limnocylindrales bacterium]
MIKPESLDFPVLNCSLASTLGDYYQDLTGAFVLVDQGYHGAVDAQGVPVDRAGERSAITASQYGLASITAVHRGEDSRIDLARALADWLVADQETEGPWAGCWIMRADNKKYAWLRAGWTSALASGNAISMLLRAWELFGDERYLAAATLAYEGLHQPRDAMRLAEETNEDLWYEEYPAEPPVRVLNGHIYALLGVADFARVSGDPVAHQRWRKAARTAIRHLPAYDLGYWSAYDLRWREPATLHYQRNIHVPLLRILAGLTGDKEVAKRADRWERYYRSRVSRARWQLAIRLHPRLKRPPWQE